MKAPKKWIKKHWHPIVRNMVVWATYPFVRFRYGCKPERFQEENGRPYLILFNRVTDVLEALETSDMADIREMLIRAQQEAEEAFIEAGI